MKVISWNIRGLNSKGKQRYLKEKLRVEKPQVMLIQETKVSMGKLETILKTFKPYYEVMALDARGTVGGITIVWNLVEVTTDNWVALSRSLTGRFRQIGTKKYLGIMAVYDPHIQGEQATFLTSIRNLRNLHQDKY